MKCDACGNDATLAIEYDTVTHYFCDCCAPNIRCFKVKIYVVLETFWATTNMYYPQLVKDSDGKVLRFNTKEEAQKYSDEELQKGQVIEIAESAGNNTKKNF